MTRARKRFGVLVFMFLVGAACIVAGFDGWTVNFLSAEWFGYAFIAFVVASLLGFNVFYKGPLDPRDDPSHVE